MATEPRTAAGEKQGLQPGRQVPSGELSLGCELVGSGEIGVFGHVTPWIEAGISAKEERTALGRLWEALRLGCE